MVKNREDKKWEGPGWNNWQPGDLPNFLATGFLHLILLLPTGQEKVEFSVAFVLFYPLAGHSLLIISYSAH